MMRREDMRFIRLKFVGPIVLAGIGSLAACAPKNGPVADLVLKNGLIHTMNGAGVRAEALAVKDGRFLFVGTNEAVNRFMGTETRAVDLGGKLVLPGFIDSHCHPSAAVEQFGAVALFGMRSVAEYQKAIVDFVNTHPGATVIRGSGWSNTVFGPAGPDKAILDEVVRDLPVALSSEDGHSTWVNSRALDLAGVTKETKDPPGGVIERDPVTGEPNGTLRESAAGLVSKVIPDYTVEELARGLEEYQTMALAFGITTAHEASLGVGGNSLEAYKALETAARLRMRFRASLYTDPEKGPEQVREQAAERDRNRGPLFQTRTAKIFIDGVIEGGTAYLKEPYAHKPGFRGKPLWTPEALDTICAALDKKGFQLHFHAIGDAAVAEALDGIAFAARINGRRDSRAMLTHLQLVSPEDVLRFKALGAVAVTQPFWFMKDDYYSNIQVPYLGLKRADEEYPMESFFRAGVMVTSSSDYTVTIPCDPIQAIQIGMTRSRPGLTDPGAVLWPGERASLEQMLASLTVNGAYANFLENTTGTIETGKSADLVVLDKNLFDLPADKIGTAKVILTLFEGREVSPKRFP
jgi:predicted amidohydrolase YtcJ